MMVERKSWGTYTSALKWTKSRKVSNTVRQIPEEKADDRVATKDQGTPILPEDTWAEHTEQRTVLELLLSGRKSEELWQLVVTKDEILKLINKVSWPRGLRPGCAAAAMPPLAATASLRACCRGALLLLLLLLAPAAPHRPGQRDHILRDLNEYSLVIPTSTDSEGMFLSNVVSGVSKRRLRRDTGNLTRAATSEQIFYNVTVFGRELHFRLRPNSRLVAPGATVEWQDDFNITYTEPLSGDCLYVGDIADLPNASVAISNCDGLVRCFLVVYLRRMAPPLRHISFSFLM
ncbi:A disintegrin and metalloproteinase with thrombospondin motifs 2 [Varanus komodoensis]|nr:A disintegrin and metalloproteinase with thrombospondin motifs 2 [Varanus komodoensis]